MFMKSSFDQSLKDRQSYIDSLKYSKQPIYLVDDEVNQNVSTTLSEQDKRIFFVVNTHEFIKEHYPDALQHIVQSQTQPSNINLGSLQISKNSLFLTSMIKDGHYTAFNIAWKLCEQAKICTPNSDKTLLDACANVGGNTLWFAQYFNQVTACEMNRKEFERLEQNMVHTYGLQHVNVVNDTCLNVITQPNQRWNVIFFDPPWGGQYYKYVQKLILALDEEDIGSIIEYCFKFDKCDMIILKHPSNWFTTVVNKKFHTFTFIKQDEMSTSSSKYKPKIMYQCSIFLSTKMFQKLKPFKPSLPLDVYI